MKVKFCMTLILVMALSVAGCATTNQQAQTSALLGAVGAGAGAALDGGNRWQGALLGGLAGMVTGYGLATINQQNQPAPLPPPPAQSGYYTPGASYYPQTPYSSQNSYNPNGYHPYRAPYCIYCY